VSESRTVTADVVFWLVVPGKPRIPIVATLAYATGDPYAVMATFHDGSDEPVAWTFARDLLGDGIHEPAGVGDVVVYPDGDDGERVRIDLCSPFGEARFEALAEDLAGFLCQTYELVPENDEHFWVDVDAEIDGLDLRAGGAR